MDVRQKAAAVTWCPARCELRRSSKGSDGGVSVKRASSGIMYDQREDRCNRQLCAVYRRR